MNISFSRLGNHGRLGNQLFQIASTLGLAEKYNATASFPSWAYEQYFETAIPHGSMERVIIKEEFFRHYDWHLKRNCDIVGYLQSEKYFGSNKLKLNQDLIDQCKDKYPIFNKEVILIQIRRGDYVGNNTYYQLPITFYIDALLTYFPNWRDYNILITSDDIEYCRVHFECLPNVTFSTSSEIEDLALGASCNHFIISSSTFGWWQAYLGRKKNSKVIHSGYLFAGTVSDKSIEDYWPKDWTSHYKDNYKINLQDTTFTIPVHYDHADRKNNLDLSLCILQKDIDANYIICEQGSNEFSYVSQWARYLKFEGKEFHRTRMLNWMTELSETPIVINWDCDVFIPPMQLYLAVDKIRSKEYDMIYPYDGRFARMSRGIWFSIIQKSLDIGVTINTPFKNREHGHNSVGGAVIFNKMAFMDGGGENENMISFGPEDAERNDRFKRLGYKVMQPGIPGSLFHMDHFVGTNSSPRNPYFKSNHVEIGKIRSMSNQQLREYVDTWPWRHRYTSLYYNRIAEGAIQSAEIVLSKLSFEYKTVIDIGCGLGEWNNDNKNYTGVDYGIDKKQLLFPASNYIECDLEKEFPNLLWKGFDLCLCLEVAEHISKEKSSALIKMLCSLSDKVLFSAAIPMQGGVGHINEQWQSYWALLFIENGFGASKKQPDIRYDNNVELWYRQNIVLYERNGKGLVVNFVLPEYYQEIVLNLHNRLEMLKK